MNQYQIEISLLVHKTLPSSLNIRNLRVLIAEGFFMNIENYIDHTLLKPLADQSLYEQLVKEAIKYKFKAICIPPTWIDFCKKQHHAENLNIATVVGFPLGYNETESKAFEALSAYKSGANEIDFVTNLSWVKSKKFDLIKREYNMIRNAVPEAVIKVILEAGQLNEIELKKLCDLAKDAELDFVKTSTGFFDIGARASDIKIMLASVGERVKIKASGGIKSYEQAKEFIDLGVQRIGCSESVTIFQQAQTN